MNTKRGQKQNATLELWKVNLATWIRTLTLSHSLSLHLLSSNFVLIHLIISSIILPPPSHPSAPHDCLFIYPFTPLSLSPLPPEHNVGHLTFCSSHLSTCPFFFLFLSLSVSYPLFTLPFSPPRFHFPSHSHRYLQFTLRLGSRSTLSSCPAPDQPGEGVLLHYSSDNGITWTLLQHYAYQGFHEPRYVQSVCVCVRVCTRVCVWLRCVSARPHTLVAYKFHRDPITPLTHTFAPLMACWRCKPLGPIESVSAIYVCNEDEVGLVPAAQAGSQSSSSPPERSAGVDESGTSYTMIWPAGESACCVQNNKMRRKKKAKRVG